MIDDAVLERLLLDTADSLTAPDEGAARVLDERDQALSADESHSTRRRYARDRRFQLGAAAAAVIAVVAVAAALSAVGGAAKQLQTSNATGNGAPASSPGTIAGPSSSGGGISNGSTGAGTVSGGTATGLPAASAGGASASAESGSGGTTSGSDTPAPAVPAPDTNPSEVPTGGVATKVIKTAQVSLAISTNSTNALTTTMTKLGSIAGGQGGYVASSGTNSAAPGQMANGSATLRVPVANFSAALDQVEALGTPTSVTTSGQDVTSQYVDLQARLQALETARTQYEQILTQAKSIPDILSVEQQLSDLQTQIEQLQGQMNVLADQTTYSTITVSVSEGQATPPPAARPPSGISKAWAHARHAFASGFESVLAASGGIAVFLVIVVIVLGIGRLAWGRARRRMV